MSNADLGGTFPLGARVVNRIGYGAMQLAGDNVFGPPRDRDEALRVLETAIANGINHIDTAQYYGPGVVNELIHEALYPYPEDLTIVSKVAARRNETGGVLPYDEPDELRMGVEDNLVSLGVDRLAAVNLRLMDGSPPSKRFDAQVDAMSHARDEGLIEGIGLSNISRDHLLRALDRTEIVCVQNLFNLADQRARGLLEECAARGIAFVPFCPLGFPSSVQHEILTSSVIAELAIRLVATPAQVALAWLLDLAPNVLIIAGTRTRQHLVENIGSGTVTFDESARLAIDSQFPLVRSS